MVPIAIALLDRIRFGWVPADRCGPVSLTRVVTGAPSSAGGPASGLGYGWNDGSANPGATKNDVVGAGYPACPASGGGT
jgi:hypothetical protein